MGSLHIMPSKSPRSAEPLASAGFVSRVVAAMLDMALCWALTYGVGLIVGFVHGVTLVFGDTLNPQRISHLSVAVVIIVPTWFILRCWIRTGATPAMRLLGLRIVDAKTGGHPSSLRFLGRFFGLFVTNALWWISIIAAYADPQGRYVHDRLTGMRVIDLRRPSGRVAGFWEKLATGIVFLGIMAGLVGVHRYNRSLLGNQFEATGLERRITQFLEPDADIATFRVHKSDFALVPGDKTDTWEWTQVMNAGQVTIRQKITPEKDCIATVERKNASPLTIQACLGQEGDAKFISPSGEELIIVRKIPSPPSQEDIPAAVLLFQGEEMVQDYSLNALLRGNLKIPSENPIVSQIASLIPSTDEHAAVPIALMARELKNRRGIAVETLNGMYYILTYSGLCYASEQPLASLEDGTYRWIDALGELHIVSTLKAVPGAQRQSARWVPPGEPCKSFLSTAERESLAKKSRARTKTVVPSTDDSRDSDESPIAKVWNIFADKPLPTNMKTESSDRAPTTSTTPRKRQSGTVTLYGTSWCGSCKAAKQYMLKNRLTFIEKDVEYNKSAAMECKALSGCTSVPVIAVGSRHMVGFDAQGLERLIQ